MRKSHTDQSLPIIDIHESAFCFILEPSHRAPKGQPLTIEIKTPELEALIQERLRNGGFTDVDELLTKALESLPADVATGSSARPAKRLVDVLMSPPFAASGLTIERLKQCPPPAVLL